MLLSALASFSQHILLYAGSNGFTNYRHQADIFTIYHQILARGIDKSQISLYAYDDVATDPSNPFEGQMFHTLDHKTNVYPGSDAIDVKGDKVTAQAFTDAISTLPTTSEDYVFIYYDNHGGPGILGTPVGDSIHAADLAEALNTASTKRLYKQCLFIIEACYSGSVAETFTAENLATITAANGEESSYAAVYDSSVGAYLTNEFTNYFLNIIDETPEISIGELYDNLKEDTQKSHVCYFGDESMKSISLSTFIGTPKRTISHNKNRASFQLVKPREATEKTLKFLSEHSKASIRSRARLQQLRLKAQSEKLEAVLDLLVKYVDPKNYDKIMNDTKSKITPAYYDVLRVFTKQFGEINPDDFGRFNVLKALAATHTKTEIIQGIFAVIF